MPKTNIDAEPFRRILWERLEIIERNLAGKDGSESGRMILSEQAGISPRPLFAIMHGQRTLTFDVADRIVTRILGPMAWFEREELNEIYMSFDLRRLDYGKPVNDLIRKRNIKEVKDAVEKHGSYRAAAKAMGLKASVLHQIVAPPVDYSKGIIRFVNPVCNKGHDKRVTGATKNGHCKVCRRERSREIRAMELKIMEERRA